MTAVLPLNENFRPLITEVAKALQPHFPDITVEWRQSLSERLGLDPRVLAALERMTFGVGATYFCHGDFQGFAENVEYFAARLAKLQVDSRTVRAGLEAYERLCEPSVASLFDGRIREALAAIEMVSSATFVSMSTAYYDAKNSETQALLATLEAELASTDVSSMLQSVLEAVSTTFEAVIGAVLLRDTETDLLRVEAAVGFEDGIRGEFRIELGRGIAGAIVETGEPQVVTNVNKDPRVISPVLREKAKSLWGMPIKHKGVTIAALVIGFDKLYEWLPAERDLLRSIADRAGLAINRARMTDALREREVRIAELSTHLLKAQEEERKRISRELHDETGQALMVIRLYLGMLDATLSSKPAKAKVKETVEVVDRTIVGIRRIIGKLSPLVLQELGLFAAIRKEAKDLEKNKGVLTRVAISDDIARMSNETEVTIYRIVQEALHNVAKHAKAENVNIAMHREGEKVRLLVEDDGVGIFPKSNFRGNSFGLAGIKERVGMLGGEVRVISLKGEGTRIEISVPATQPSEDSREFFSGTPVHAVVAAANGRGKVHAEN